VGGFPQSFSGGEICRICHLKYENLPSLNGIPSAEEWSTTEYDSVCDQLENDTGTEKQKFKLKGRCVFNCLQSFHSVGQIPLDAMHDWMEKIAATDGQSVVLAFVSENSFALEDYNNAVRNIKLADYEACDQILIIKASADKLCGKAMSVAQHLRLMPFIISRLAKDVENSHLFKFLVVLHRLNEYIMADVVNPYEALLLQVPVINCNLMVISF
jgi:hypothetical protein